MDPYAPAFGHIKTQQQALDELPSCKTEWDLERLATRISEPATQPAEFNFPADVIMLVDAMLLVDRVPDPDARETLAHIRAAGEQAMLQLAFFNLGLQVPSPFINKVHEAGWRYAGGWQVPK
jgi:hypothetical protein